MNKTLFVLAVLPFIGLAQQQTSMDKNIAAIEPKLVEWRRCFHQHPELSNREYQTAAFIAEFLKTLGMEVQASVGKTGMVAILKGSKPGPVVALRADMDALPVYERNDLKRMQTTATNIAEASGATATLSIETQTKVTYNDPALVKMMLPSLQKAAGDSNVEETEWTTGAEGFSYFGDKAPAFFFFLGSMPAGEDPYTAPAHHTPDFYIDDSKLGVGVKAFCQMVTDYERAYTSKK